MMSTDFDFVREGDTWPGTQLEVSLCLIVPNLIYTDLLTNNGIENSHTKASLFCLMTKSTIPTHDPGYDTILYYQYVHLNPAQCSKA